MLIELFPTGKLEGFYEYDGKEPDHTVVDLHANPFAEGWAKDPHQCREDEDSHGDDTFLSPRNLLKLIAFLHLEVEIRTEDEPEHTEHHGQQDDHHG